MPPDRPEVSMARISTILDCQNRRNCQNHRNCRLVLGIARGGIFSRPAGAVSEGDILQLNAHSLFALTPVQISCIDFFPDAREATRLNGIAGGAGGDGNGAVVSRVTDLE